MNTSSVNFSKDQARRFLLSHHELFPPRRLEGKAGILSYFSRVGCIQFDPVNIVGRNPQLIFQSRVKDFRVGMLEDLLYKDRLLLDGWDKFASVYRLEDHPNFNWHRERMRKEHDYPAGRVPPEITSSVLDAIRQKGALCSLDFEHQDKMDWFWGIPVRAERAALENLYGMGYLGIDHRSGSRRYFDLIEKLVPQEFLQAPNPLNSLEDYQRWHVLRRIGSLGLANPGSGEHWGGIIGVKSKRRQEIIEELQRGGLVQEVEVESQKRRKFFARSSDLERFQANPLDEHPNQASIIAPLDNLIWDRGAVKWIFDFNYIWEVYKPAQLRKYGHYTLPILFGDRFIARFEPALEKKKGVLKINGWWWEEGVTQNPGISEALIACFEDFLKFLGVGTLRLNESLPPQAELTFLDNLNVL